MNLAPSDLTNLAIAIGLGLVVGLQRQWAEKEVAGARTFALITLLGALSSMLGQEFGGWIVAVALIAVALALMMGNVVQLGSGEANPGMTTEVAGLAMFVVGALLPLGHRALAVVAAGVVALLLQWKQPLHAFVRKLSQADIQAAMRLVLIGLVILPILPDRGLGPYQVINPHRIWLMVVLIVGISLAAHLAHLALGDRVGTVLAGVFGGLISSTATTVGYARQARVQPRISGVAAVVIVIASTVVIG
ncbi:MAG: MgtC/SapB family protein, partial [Gemmatimonadota bacterium]